MTGGWSLKEFSEIAEIFNGNSISKKDKETLYTGLTDGVPYIGTKDVGFDHVIEYDNGVLIPESKAKDFKIAPPNSVLVCSEGGSAGRKVAHNIRNTHFGNKLFAIVPSDAALSKYLYYYTLSREFKESFKGLMTGVIGGVSLKKFKSIKLPVPTVTEQKRIVAILDETFVGIDAAIANTEKNLTNARELFESYLDVVFTNDVKGWESVRLKDISTKITDGVHKKPHYVDNGVPFIKINNLTVGPGISFKDVSYISNEDHELFCKRTKPEKGDLLITKDGTIGIVRIIDTDVEFSIFVSVALIKPIDKSITPYLRYVLESPLIQNQINPQGAALKHLYLRDLREYLVPLPPKEVRDRIVERLNSFTMESTRLEFIYKQKLNSLKELKQSLLQKAFSGELTSEGDKLMDEAVA